jgi:predicted nucleotidyltransferase
MRLGSESSKAYVYGSYAKATQKADSDIDIAVVADGLSGDAVDDTWRLMKLRRSIDTRIEPHPFLPCDFTEANPMVAEVMRRGESPPLYLLEELPFDPSSAVPCLASLTESHANPIAGESLT